MSKENYEKAVVIIEKNKEQCFWAGSKNESLILKAEKILDIKFSALYRLFLLKYGAGSIGAEEIYGVINEDFDNSGAIDSVWYTLTERREIQFPYNLLLISDRSSDEFFCLDFNRLNEIGEPPVVVYVPGMDEKYQTYEVLSEDFGDYLLGIVEEELLNK